jgi:hypothetical protein
MDDLTKMSTEDLTALHQEMAVPPPQELQALWEPEQIEHLRLIQEALDRREHTTVTALLTRFLEPIVGLLASDALCATLRDKFHEEKPSAVDHKATNLRLVKLWVALDLLRKTTQLRIEEKNALQQSITQELDAREQKSATEEAQTKISGLEERLRTLEGASGVPGSPGD